MVDDVLSQRRLRPHSHLFQQGATAVVAFMAPVFIVLYVLTVPDGAWRAVLGTHITATILVGIAFIRYLTTAIWVSPGGITERGYFGRRHSHSIDEIGSLVLANTYQETNTLPQLFVCDHEGRPLVRMRGQFWSQQSMDVVVAVLGLPLATLEDSITPGELRAGHPELLYWFERHPFLTAGLFVAGTTVFGFGLLAVLVATGTVVL